MKRNYEEDGDGYYEENPLPNQGEHEEHAHGSEKSLDMVDKKHPQKHLAQKREEFDPIDYNHDKMYEKLERDPDWIASEREDW